MFHTKPDDLTLVILDLWDSCLVHRVIHRVFISYVPLFRLFSRLILMTVWWAMRMGHTSSPEILIPDLLLQVAVTSLSLLFQGQSCVLPDRQCVYEIYLLIIWWLRETLLLLLGGSNLMTGEMPLILYYRIFILCCRVQHDFSLTCVSVSQLSHWLGSILYYPPFGCCPLDDCQSHSRPV